MFLAIRVVFIAALGTSAVAAPRHWGIPLSPCNAPARPSRPSEGGPMPMCGTYSVWENRTAAKGRRIALNLMVIPATGENPPPDPIFFLAGGPGQPAVNGSLRPVVPGYDTVLV